MPHETAETKAPSLNSHITVPHESALQVRLLVSAWSVETRPGHPYPRPVTSPVQLTCLARIPRHGDKCSGMKPSKEGSQALQCLINSFLKLNLLQILTL